MRVAFSSPQPYLLNQAGGICMVKEFAVSGGHLTLVPVSEQPLTGQYQLVYRCPDHDRFDVKLAVSSDGASWSLVGKPTQQQAPDACFPGPCA